MKSPLFAIAAALMMLATSANGQVTGRVVEKGQPVVGAAVVAEQTGSGAATDADGRFSINNIGTFPARLRVSCLGYNDTTVTAADARARLEIELTPKEQTVEGVVVVGNRREGFSTVDAKSAQILGDAAGGIEAAVKQQMGVSSNNELSSQYRVRGGNFDENMVYVDNVEIYRPFLIRSGEQEGLSFVNADLVDHIDFSSGGFDVSFADRMSSVLDVKYKTPTRTAGSLRAGFMGASAHFEGAVRNGVLSHITGVRYKTNRYVFGSLDTDGDYDPSFFDVQTLVRIGRPQSAWRGSVMGYYARNRYRFVPTNRETSFGTISDAKTLRIYFDGKEDDRYITGLAAAWLNFEPNGENRYSLVASVYSSSEQERYDILGEYWLQQAESASTAEGTDESEGIGVGAHMEHARNELYGRILTTAVQGSNAIGRHTLRWEARAQAEHFDDYVDEWEYRDSAGYISPPTMEAIVFDRLSRGDNELNSVRTSAYLMDCLRFEKVSVTFGVRVSHLSANGETLVSPRASFSYAPNRKWNFRLAAGSYSQSPFFREMRRDDGSLNTDVEAQRSWQFFGGFDHYMFASGNRVFRWSVEAYYKHLSEINPYTIDNVRIRYMADNCASGYAYGIDMKIHGEIIEGTESRLCLSLMKTEEDIEGDGAGYIPRPTDQRFSLSANIHDHLPSNKSMIASLNMYFASGLPFGPPDSPRRMATNRMPGYKRIDLGLTKDFAKRADGTGKLRHIKSLQIGLEIFNLFDFSNTISYFWVTDVQNRQYAVPNYLTSRRLNVKMAVEF